MRGKKIMSNNPDFNEKNGDEVIAEFELNEYNNHLLQKALEQKNTDVVLAILRKDDFALDATIRIGTDNLLMYAIRHDLDDVTDALFKQPDRVLKDLITYTLPRNYSYEAIINSFTLAISKNKPDILTRIVESGFTCPRKDADIVRAASISLEMCKAFPWDEESVNYTTKDVYAGMDSYRSVSLIENLLENQLWDNANFLVLHDAFNPFYLNSKYAYRSYKVARQLSNKHSEAKEISDIILRRIEELNPKKAKKLKKGFFGLGKHKL